MIPVAANDVGFSIHAVLLTVITLLQIAIFEVFHCSVVAVFFLDAYRGVCWGVYHVLKMFVYVCFEILHSAVFRESPGYL